LNKNTKIALFLIVGFLIFHFSRKTDSPKIDKINLSIIPLNPQLDGCLKSNLCLVAYVAPWCGACHKFIQQNNKLKTHFENKNVKVLYVVGADKNRANEVEMKNNIGDFAILDTESHAFMKAHQIYYFPTVYEVGAAGKVLAQGSDAFDKINLLLNSN
jgi:thiol-disulfide isomerase/thioredoxin